MRVVNLYPASWHPGEDNGALRDRVIRENRSRARQSPNPNRGKRHAARLAPSRLKPVLVQP